MTAPAYSPVAHELVARFGGVKHLLREWQISESPAVPHNRLVIVADELRIACAPGQLGDVRYLLELGEHLRRLEITWRQALHAELVRFARTIGPHVAAEFDDCLLVPRPKEHTR